MDTRDHSGGEEGGVTDTYLVLLTARPRYNVVVTLEPDEQLGAVPTQLTFTPDTWDVPQTVTVSAEDDDLVEGPHLGTITHTAHSSDWLFDDLDIDDLEVEILDND